jgi:hypothetical protein
MREQKVKLIELEEYTDELEQQRKLEATLALKQRILEKSRSRSNSSKKDNF